MSRTISYQIILDQNNNLSEIAIVNNAFNGGSDTVTDLKLKSDGNFELSTYRHTIDAIGNEKKGKNLEKKMMSFEEGIAYVQKNAAAAIKNATFMDASVDKENLPIPGVSGTTFFHLNEDSVFDGPADFKLGFDKLNTYLNGIESEHKGKNITSLTGNAKIIADEFVVLSKGGINDTEYAKLMKDAGKLKVDILLPVQEGETAINQADAIITQNGLSIKVKPRLR